MGAAEQAHKAAAKMVDTNAANLFFIFAAPCYCPVSSIYNKRKNHPSCYTVGIFSIRIFLKAACFPLSQRAHNVRPYGKMQFPSVRYILLNVLLYFDYTMPCCGMERNLLESSGKCPHYAAKSPRHSGLVPCRGLCMGSGLAVEPVILHQRYCHCPLGLRRQRQRFRGWLPPRLPAQPYHRQRRSLHRC